MSYYCQERNAVHVCMEDLADHLRAIRDQLIVVTVIGPYQSGKSSFIQYLTGDDAIQVGYGVEEQTQGVWFYGPYDLNALKSRWGTPEIADDNTKVVFFDSEGFGGSAGASEDENRIIICDLIAPYLAISQVCILLHACNPGRGTLETIKYFLEVTERICSGANNTSYGDGSMKVVDISTGVARYKIGQRDESGNETTVDYQPDNGTDSFREASASMRRIQSPRFGTGNNHLLIDQFWPLPAFNQANPINGQNESFQRGFRFICLDLFRIIDDIKQLHAISGEDTFNEFEMFREGMAEEDLQSLAARARQLAEFNTAQRIIQPFVDAVVRDCNARSEEHEISLSQRLNDTCRTPDDTELDFRGPIEEAMRTINNFAGVTESVRRSELWQAMLTTTLDGLTRFADDKKREYLDRLRKRQLQYIGSSLERTLNGQLTKEYERLSDQYSKETKIEKIPLREISESLWRVANSELERLANDLRPFHDDLLRIRACVGSCIADAVAHVANDAIDMVHRNSRDRAITVGTCCALCACMACLL